MALTLYYHPLSSYCHKVLVALYELGVPFEPGLLPDLTNPAERARFQKLSPMGKFPLLVDSAHAEPIHESSIIIEYLDRHYPGPTPLLPADPGTCLEVRQWDRLSDLYLMTPMQRVIGDDLRPEDRRDSMGVSEALAMLAMAYEMFEARLKGRDWLAGDAFSMADCAAAAALFYTEPLVRFTGVYPALTAYFERLLARPSYARVLTDARPWLKYYPRVAALDPRFLGD